MWLQIAKCLFVVFGHLAISCMLFNMVHAAATPRRHWLFGRKFSEKAILAFAVVPIALFIWHWSSPLQDQTGFRSRASALYGAICMVVAGGYVIRWLYRMGTGTLPVGAEVQSSETIDVQSRHSGSLLSGVKARLFGSLPFNQVTKLQIQRRQLRFHRLPAALSGFRICQLSDLHLTGLIKPEYFQAVVECANAEQPDLTVITGDILDGDDCLDWIEEVLSRLRARHGVYYVLGNHDRLVSDQPRLRQRLQQAGLKQAANGHWHSIPIGDAMLLLAGNELPWYREANHLTRVRPQSENQFSLLLAHSPDQIGWAVHRDFDLMLAGHTHGGQIRLPLVGPVIAPSCYGIKYASGTFRARDTLMHVSRGVSSDEPIRLNCLPELAVFTLLGKNDTAVHPG